MEGMTEPQPRNGYRRRSLRDSWLEVSVDLDRALPIDVVTDSDVLSEALKALAAGGGFSLRLHCEGGPCSDLRRVVEDCALELGAALRDALGPAVAAPQRSPVRRHEAPGAHVSVDFTGPPGALCSGFVGLPRVDALPAGLTGVLFDSLGHALGAQIEVEARSRVPREAIGASFAGLGRALRAISDAQWPRRREAVSRW